MASNHLWRQRSLCAIAFWMFAAAQVAVGQLPDFGGLGGGSLGGRGLGGDETVNLDAEFTPAEDGRPALLFLTARIAPGYHIFAVDQGHLPDGGGPLPTTLTLSESEAYRLIGAFQPLERPKTMMATEDFWKGLELREHEERVTWVAPIELAEGVKPSEVTVEGLFDGQACNPSVCVPLSLSFAAEVGAGMALPPGLVIEVQPAAATSGAAEVPAGRSVTSENPPSSAIASPSAPEWPTPNADQRALVAPVPVSPSVEPSQSVYDLSRIELQPVASRSLWYYLLTAFIGGMILNVMPCVLPVIGLKVMSFVQQSGESRARALMLNVWYSAGIVAVFLALAGLAVSLQVGWGDQFGNSWFLITLTAVVFAMALSMIGMWEIPIPGFVSSGVVMDAAHREGATAAFLKGVLTTILATPCTGPYMVSGVAWAVEQPPMVTFAVFGALGLGMASPYLLIGAFPNLIRFLPKPGVWMETFKKAMGMVLLATVVWLMSTLDFPLLVPTFALLVGITAACWWIDRTPAYQPLGERVRSWAEGLTLTAVTAAASFGLLYPNVTLPRYEAQLKSYAQSNPPTAKAEPWQEFTLGKLSDLTLNDRRTVLVDFTADWCVSCKVFESTVLKTDEVLKALGDADVVTMTADYTKKPTWMRETIRALGGIGVPVVAIFPADRPYHPIVFTGGYTKGGLLDAIADATRGSGTMTASRGGSGGM
jgi:suppressor for copper-sensitivity B